MCVCVHSLMITKEITHNCAYSICLDQGSAPQNVGRDIVDHKNKKQICLELQKGKSLIKG